MSLGDLLRKGIIEAFKSSKEQIANEMAIAEDDLDSSKKLIEIGDWKWAFSAAYNAMLQASRALMFSSGYIPKSESHHLAVIMFIREVHGSKFPEEALITFEKARKLRNEATYESPHLISEKKARNLVEIASIFIFKAKEILNKR